MSFRDDIRDRPPSANTRFITVIGSLSSVLNIWVRLSAAFDVSSILEL